MRLYTPATETNSNILKRIHANLRGVWFWSPTTTAQVVRLLDLMYVARLSTPNKPWFSIVYRHLEPLLTMNPPLTYLQGLTLSGQKRFGPLDDPELWPIRLGHRVQRPRSTALAKWQEVGDAEYIWISHACPIVRSIIYLGWSNGWYDLLRDGFNLKIRHFRPAKNWCLIVLRCQNWSHGQHWTYKSRNALAEPELFW